MLEKLGVVGAITINTYRELVRDRLLYAFIIFAVLTTVLGILLGSLSAGENTRTLSDIGLFATAMIGGIIAIFSGANLVYKEFERKTISIIFVKPVTGWQFVLGKYLGSSLCLFLIVAAMAVFLVFLLFTFGGNVLFDFAKEFSTVGRCMLLIFLELAFVCSLAVFFSTFATPTMSVIFTASLWLIGHFGESLKDLGELSKSHAVSQFFNLLYWLLPDLGSLSRVRSELLHGFEPSLELIAYLVAYVLAYIVLLLTVAALIIEKREFA